MDESIGHDGNDGTDTADGSPTPQGHPWRRTDLRVLGFLTVLAGTVWAFHGRGQDGGDLPAVTGDALGLAPEAPLWVTVGPDGYRVASAPGEDPREEGLLAGGRDGLGRLRAVLVDRHRADPSLREVRVRPVGTVADTAVTQVIDLVYEVWAVPGRPRAEGVTVQRAARAVRPGVPADPWRRPRMFARVSPLGVSPLGVSPLGVSPRGVSPRGVTPGFLHPGGIAYTPGLHDRQHAAGWSGGRGDRAVVLPSG